MHTPRLFTHLTKWKPLENIESEDIFRISYQLVLETRPKMVWTNVNDNSQLMQKRLVLSILKI
jgi:hypothetical protein